MKRGSFLTCPFLSFKNYGQKGQVSFALENLKPVVPPKKGSLFLFQILFLLGKPLENLPFHHFFLKGQGRDTRLGTPSCPQGQTKAFHSFIPFHHLKKKKGQKRRVFFYFTAFVLLLLFYCFCFTAFVLLLLFYCVKQQNNKTTKQEPKYYFLRDTSEKGQFSCVPSWQPFPVPFFLKKREYKGRIEGD